MNYKKKSDKQEKRTAKQIGGSTTKASGATLFDKGDVRNDRFLVECKTTEKLYYSLSIKIWKKIKNEALRKNMRIPIMCIQVNDTDTSENIAVLSWNDFMGLMLDKNIYNYKGQPIMVDALSYRITSDFMYQEIQTRVIKKEAVCQRQDIKFVNENIHLVCLKWEDFLRITQEV